MWSVDRSVKVLLVVLVALVGWSAPLMAAPGGELVMQIPTGQDGIHIEGIAPEMLPWGPMAFTISGTGQVWIADTAADRLMCFEMSGQSCGALELQGQVEGIGDLEVAGEKIWLLDMATSPAPTLLQVTLDGTVLEKRQLPPGLRLEDGLSGLWLGEAGELLVEREGGALLDEVVTASGQETQMPWEGYLSQGRTVVAVPADMSSKNASSGALFVDGIRVDVEVEHSLGGLRVLGFAPDGSVYVIAEEVALDGVILVDQTVRHYDTSGRLLGMARIPLAGQLAPMPHNLAVGPDGAVYTMLTYADRAEIRRLDFSEKLDPILPEAVSAPASEQAGMASSPKLCRSRSTIISTASSYLNNYKYLSSTNISGSCTGRTKPRYLGSAGNYYSVSYDWGGFDTVSGFNSYMNSGYQAGDINSSGVYSCSRGVDCSGFVSRCWGTTTKYGTSTIYQISWQLGSTSSLLQGDAMNKAGSHIVLFSFFSGSGMYGYESTTTSSYDRVVFMYRSWTGLTGYVPIRYDSVC